MGAPRWPPGPPGPLDSYKCYKKRVEAFLEKVKQNGPKNAKAGILKDRLKKILHDDKNMDCVPMEPLKGYKFTTFVKEWNKCSVFLVDSSEKPLFNNEYNLPLQFKLCFAGKPLLLTMFLFFFINSLLNL